MDVRAFLCMVMSAISFAFMTVTAKSLENLNAFQLVFFRAMGALVICYLVLKYLKVPLKGTQQKLLIWRGIVGTISLCLFFNALKLMPVGAVLSLRYLAPFFGMVLALFMLKEQIRKIQWLFVFIAFCGAVMIKGFDPRISSLALIIILCSAFFSGFVYVLIRMLGKGDHPIVIVFYFMLIAAITGLVLSLPNWKEIAPSQYVSLLGLGVFGFFGQYFMTVAFQREETNKVAPLKYLETVIAMILAWIWLNEGYNPLTLAGIALVILGVILNSVTKKKALIK